MSSKKPVKKQPRKQVSSWVIFFISLAIIVALVAVIKFTGNPKPIVELPLKGILLIGYGKAKP